MAVCSKEYLENRCAPGTRVPAMEKACLAWEKCMNRDPTVVGRARVSAETFAEIINSFIEPISYKTMVSPLYTEATPERASVDDRYFVYWRCLDRFSCQISHLDY
jgi:Di-sulfide bridge nucleocytoplasmic transport domain